MSGWNKQWWFLQEKLERLIDEQIESSLNNDDSGYEQARLDILETIKIMLQIDLTKSDTATRQQLSLVGDSVVLDEEATSEYAQQLFNTK
jgi:hypothetical protein